MARTMTKKEKLAIVKALYTVCDNAYKKVSKAQCDAKEISIKYGEMVYSVGLDDIQKSINDVNKAWTELTVTNAIRQDIVDELEKNGISLDFIEEV